MNAQKLGHTVPLRIILVRLATNGWRKSVGVEPTRDVVRPSLDLKSRRPTGVRSSSLLSIRWYRENICDGTPNTTLVATSFCETDPVEILQNIYGKVSAQLRLIPIFGSREIPISRICSQPLGNHAKLCHEGRWRISIFTNQNHYWICLDQITSM